MVQVTGKRRWWGLLTVAMIAGTVLAGCATPVPSGTGGDDASPGSETPGASDDIAAAAALVEHRYELVRDGDYAGACALYSDAYAELFIELADAAGSSCVEAHAKAAQNAADYQATAAAQDRAGLTPFFFVPSSIEVDPTAIKNDEPGLAFLGEGTVVSLDTTAFEDGPGKTPGWLAGQDYVKQGDDGTWRFISAAEQ